MSKNMKKLDKESLSWKTKYEKNNVVLLDLISEKQVRDEHITKTAKQLFYLQKLCRTLQGDRAFLLQTLKEHEIECPTIPETLPGPDAEPILPDFSTPVLTEKEQQLKNEKLDSITKNCADLKENLKMLQNQLASMTDEKEGISEGGAADKSNKKSKNKNKKLKSNKSETVSKVETKEDVKSDTPTSSTIDLPLDTQATHIKTAEEIVNIVKLNETIPSSSLTTETNTTQSLSVIQTSVLNGENSSPSVILAETQTVITPNQQLPISEDANASNTQTESNVPKMISNFQEKLTEPVLEVEQPSIENVVNSEENVVKTNGERNLVGENPKEVENKT